MQAQNLARLTLVTILRRHVENSPALLTVDDFLARFRVFHGRGGQFHVAAGANTVFDGDNGGIAFAGEESFEASQQILVHPFRQFLSLLR